MKNLLFIFLVLFSLQNHAQEGSVLTAAAAEGCAELDLYNPDLPVADFLDQVGGIIDPIGRGIETHGTITPVATVAQKSYSEKAGPNSTNSKLLIELNSVSDANTIKRLQMLIGLKLTQSSIGEYQQYRDGENFKVCVAPMESSDFGSLASVITEVVTDQDAVSTVANCPAQ